MTTDPQTDRVTAIYDAIDAFQREHRTGGGIGHAQIRALLAEHVDRALPAAAAPVAAPPTGQAGLRELVAAALYRHEWPGKQAWEQALAMDREAFLAQADAVLAALFGPIPAGTDTATWTAIRERAAELAGQGGAGGRGAALREGADRIEAMTNEAYERALSEDEIGYANGLENATKELRRLAAETPGPETQGDEVGLLRLTLDAVEEGRRELRAENARLRAQLWTLAAALDGLHTLIATSSRDWQTYRVDAWIWAVLCGWDCEQTEHDETCTHGALEETAAMHGWDADTVAKVRRYRAAVRLLTEPAVVAEPGKDPS